eukprot:1915364-Pleurochrysis_carterae.AAC.2
MARAAGGDASAAKQSQRRRQRRWWQGAASCDASASVQAAAPFDTVCNVRSEMTFGSEMLASRQVAELRRVISFGFNKTAKFQVTGMLSTNVQAEATDGLTVDIVIRGAF